MNLKESKLGYSIASLLSGLASLLVVPAIVFFNYSILGDGGVDLEKVEQSFIGLPIIYVFAIILGVLCGIIGVMKSTSRELSMILSVAGLILSGMAVVFFGEYIISIM